MKPAWVAGAVLAASWARADAPAAAPALPYESPGACPFECCTYRAWTVRADTDILSERTPGAPVAFRVRKGETVVGVTGVVVTTVPGRTRVLKETVLGDGELRVRVRPGDGVYLIHSLGEGFWKAWVRGREIQVNEIGCMGETNTPQPCGLRILSRPRTTWWVKIRKGGREGWTREVDRFGDVDRCG